MELINKGALLKAIDTERENLIKQNLLGAEHILAHNFRQLVEDAPVVEERPTAKWEYNEVSMEYFCTNCHNPSIFLNPYCSHCGASMKEEKNGIPTKKNL